MSTTTDTLRELLQAVEFRHQASAICCGVRNIYESDLVTIERGTHALAVLGWLAYHTNNDRDLTSGESIEYYLDHILEDPVLAKEKWEWMKKDKKERGF